MNSNVLLQIMYVNLQKSMWNVISTLKKNYLFIFGCAGSLLLLRLFSSCSEWGFLIAVASLVAEHRLQAHRLQQLRLMGSRDWAQQLRVRGLVAPWHVGSSWTRDGTHVPCIGRRILIHWTTREVFMGNVNCLINELIHILFCDNLVHVRWCQW